MHGVRVSGRDSVRRSLHTDATKEQKKAKETDEEKRSRRTRTLACTRVCA